MARLPRFFVSDLPLHLVQRGNNRGAIFRAPEDYALFYQLLLRAARKHGVAVHAYVFMTNHVHLVVTPSGTNSVPKMMQWLGTVYVRYFNRLYERTGTLWEGRYRAAIVEDERYLLSCMRYVELNPVRAGMASTPAAYQWSSFSANGHGQYDPLVTPHPVYLAIARVRDERCTAYRELFGTADCDNDIRDIRDATQNAWALGGEAFQKRVSVETRRAARMRRGRPAVGRPTGRDDSDRVT